MSVVRFANNLVALAFVTGFNIGFDLCVHATPSKGLGNGVDGSSHSRVMKVGAVPSITLTSRLGGTTTLPSKVCMV